MAVFISLLRGINVTGHNSLKMKDLRDLYEALGMKKVRTYLQSGNVVFESDEENPDVLTRTIEKGIKQNSDLEVKVLLRTTEELESVIDNNPFLQEENINPERLYVTFLSSSPESARMKGVPTQDKKDRFIISNEEIYLHCPDGYGRTKLSNDFFERKLKLTATTRNWKTVNALRDMARN
jgi:uncharacterized protein (DUF1697 family)